MVLIQGFGWPQTWIRRTEGPNSSSWDPTAPPGTLVNGRGSFWRQRATFSGGKRPVVHSVAPSIWIYKIPGKPSRLCSFSSMSYDPRPPPFPKTEGESCGVTQVRILCLELTLSEGCLENPVGCLGLFLILYCSFLGSIYVLAFKSWCEKGNVGG